MEKVNELFMKYTSSTEASWLDRKGWNLKASGKSYFSEKPSPFSEEAVNSTLFEKAKAAPFPPPEEAGEAAERLAAEPSTAGLLLRRITIPIK